MRQRLHPNPPRSLLGRLTADNVWLSAVRISSFVSFDYVRNHETNATYLCRPHLVALDFDRRGIAIMSQPRRPPLANRRGANRACAHPDFLVLGFLPDGRPDPTRVCGTSSAQEGQSAPQRCLRGVGCGSPGRGDQRHRRPGRRPHLHSGQLRALDGHTTALSGSRSPTSPGPLRAGSLRTAGPATPTEWRWRRFWPPCCAAPTRRTLVSTISGV